VSKPYTTSQHKQAQKIAISLAFIAINPGENTCRPQRSQPHIAATMNTSCNALSAQSLASAKI
jgi:hypothetical protein